MPGVIQFDTSEIVISEKNFAESGSYDESVYFNESYVVSGNMKAPEIYGGYDLIILGDLEADEIEVKGRLIVSGKITAETLTVEKSLICGEEIDSETIIVSGNIQAESIRCTVLNCSGNVVVQTIVEVQEEIKTENMLAAAEGIIGQGSICAVNTVTGEYFDFDGQVTGRVIDLGEDGYRYSSESGAEESSFESYIGQFKKKMSAELQKAGNMDEDHLRELAHRITELDSTRWCEWADLVDRIIDLSYEDNIENFRDYLLVVFAGHILPEEITMYETITHVFQKMLQEAETGCEDMIYAAQNAEELSQSIRIIEYCESLLPVSKEAALDKVFQSIGIKYGTVKKFLRSD